MSEIDRRPAAVRERLFEAARFAVPAKRTGLSNPAEFAEALEGFMLDAALWRQRLEEDALYMQAALKALEDQWDEIEGWQTNLPPKPQERTAKAVTEAKRMVRPDLYDGIREAKWLVDKLHRQVRRLERDEESVSRVYTIFSG